ncbi:glycoside hydrolase family 76 protein [Lederbergia wuyishanensis]|uniref:Alpha-1,6-mannanase (GH76 family) n=1 Tax=Lederbergia wuyishanensis TaxID=1347903 RepID=A0ABU0D698_9BACI|nr:glycoside hydrolase family 76 protein [Lederbergia wuyishanensis]MCJ8008664.1 glycoside hydrolase family 88 protein [Lederbergia wuyishanensis]MDQ0343917.1 putative alpha-1,6-mannanase (GH76 family) [Lederbergia wuyishanensis]
MAKKIFSLSLIFLLMLGSSTFASENHNEASFEWGDKAELAQTSLFEYYWNEETSMFNNAYECNNCNGQFHYWWLAHALDTLIDAYERTNNEVYLDRSKALYESILKRNNGAITNHFYDDMLWMSLALFRLYEHTNDPKYENAVFTLWDDIKTGWSDQFGGGIAWNKSQLDYKNTPSNAPAVILASRLYQKYRNPDDLDWAIKIYDWQKSTLVDPETGFVWDGINRTGDGKIDKNWEFTYNQGVYIGAGVELYRATENNEYLAAAIQTAETGIKRLVGNNTTNILKDEGGGDGGLFKGILVRYLGGLVKADPNQKDIAQFLINNAKSAWNNKLADDKILFGSSWERTPSLNLDLSINLSGMMLMEQAAIMEKLLAEPVSISLLNEQLNGYIATNDIKGPLVPILLSSVKQAEHHLEKGRVEQAIKHLENFQKHLHHEAHRNYLSDDANNQLTITMNLLLEELSK